MASGRGKFFHTDGDVYDGMCILLIKILPLDSSIEFNDMMVDFNLDRYR